MTTQDINVTSGPATQGCGDDCGCSTTPGTGQPTVSGSGTAEDPLTLAPADVQPEGDEQPGRHALRN